MDFTSLLPLLCGLASSLGPHSSASLSIITLCLGRFLTPSDWLPTLQSTLDLAALLQGAFQQLASLYTAQQGWASSVLCHRPLLWQDTFVHEVANAYCQMK